MPVKAISLLIIFNEIFLVGLIISSTIQRGIPTNPVFWVATIIEVTLGFLTYSAYKQYLINKSYKLWNFLILALTIIGIGTPITLFYTVDFLKPMGGTWGFYVLTANSFYLYRIIKKEPILRQDIPLTRYWTAANILHSVFLTLTLVMLIIVSLLTFLNHVPTLRNNDSNFLAINIVPLIMTLPLLAVGIFLPRVVGLIRKSDKSDAFVYFIHGIRTSLFVAVALVGLILGISGGAWYAWLPLLVLAGTAMVFTFPTQKRWEKWKAGRSPIQQL